MLALLQRVTNATVRVDNTIIGEIQQGILAFIGVEKGDDETQSKRLADRMLGYRIFSDGEDKMNLSVRNIQGGILLVPQFTLAADTRRGMRPSFSCAAAPEDGKRYFETLVSYAQSQYDKIATGQFGANMQVSLCNDGPVTFLLKV